jgi:hypothetical protein
MFSASHFPNPVQALAQRFIGLRARKERPAQCAKIKTGTANEEGHLTSAFDILDFYLRFSSPVAGSVIDFG